MSKPTVAQIPFIWPELFTGFAQGTELPFDVVAESSMSMFGVVSAPDALAVNWMDAYLKGNLERKLRVVLGIRPACQTKQSDLEDFLGLVERYRDRVAFRLYPETSILEHSSNLLCFVNEDGEAFLSLGPTENMGLSASSPSHANLVCMISAATLEACRSWFDSLWQMAGTLNQEVASKIPIFVLPRGDAEAGRLWDGFRKLCLSDELTSRPSGTPDPDSNDSDPADWKDEDGQSPTDDIGIPKLDPLAQSIARLFELGVLVTVDKLSRVPPLEAPVKPEWFDVDSFRQTGMVRAQTSIKVAPFDETTLKKIEKLRKASGDLLPRYSFALADGVRWMPKKAIPLFQAALTAANDEASKLLHATVTDDIAAFLNSQRERIWNDVQRMYQAYHPGGKIPDSAFEKIMEELKSRLTRAKGGKLIPKVAYSSIAFNPGKSSEWSSPWGQAFQLLKGIAEFPREVMVNRFFLQGIRTDEDSLILAMDVVDDYLVKEFGNRKSMQRAKIELELIKTLEGRSAEPLQKCRALWDLITEGKVENFETLESESPSA